MYNCPYCRKETYSTDFDILAQSNFKVRNSFLEEIRLSMMQELRSADILVFIGYSMPSEDTDYITMFKSLNNNISQVYTILYDDKGTNDFVPFSQLNDKAKKEVENYNKTFGTKVKYNMAGFPDAIEKIYQVLDLIKL